MSVIAQDNHRGLNQSSVLSFCLFVVVFKEREKKKRDVL